MDKLKTLIFTFALPALVLLPGAQFTSTAQSPGDIVFAEIQADPPSGAGLGEPANEYFVLCNRSGTGFNLSGWTVVDSSGIALTLPVFVLVSQNCVIVANSGIDLTATGYNCSVPPLNVILANSWFNGLSNSGDELVLSSPAPAVIDAMSYGTNTNQLNPAAPDVFDNSGASLIRTGYPAAMPSGLPDTDTNADWSSRAGDPCDVPVGPTALAATVGGSVRDQRGRGIKFVSLLLSGGNLTEPIYATTNHFGHYRFEGLAVGQTYVLQAVSQRYTFQSSSILINLDDDILNADFVAVDPGGGDNTAGKKRRGLNN